MYCPSRSSLKLLAIFFVVVVLLSLLAPRMFFCAAVRDFSGATMGTRYTVRLVDDSWALGGSFDIAIIQKHVDQRLGEINRLMSTYDAESELSKFNQHTGNDWFSVSDETATVVKFALRVAADSDGAFDPTVGPAVNLWGFGPKKTRPRLPSDEQIAAVLARVGYDQLEVQQNPPALRKSNPTLSLDLSAIAKGYAVDAISDLLAEEGYDRSMVEIGGEVRTRGLKPDDLPWRIGIEKPDTGGRSIQRIVELRDAALATSGDYRNFFERDGVRYSHTIDPTTGRPVQHRLATVTVVADSCMEADALATAVLVMGDQRGYDWCMKHGICALLMVRSSQSVVERSTPKFQQLFDNQASAK